MIRRFLCICLVLSLLAEGKPSDLGGCWKYEKCLLKKIKQIPKKLHPKKEIALKEPETGPKRGVRARQLDKNEKANALIIEQHKNKAKHGIYEFSRFTPEDDCTDLIVRLIDATDKRIVVMIYMLTCPKIILALVNAVKRGVRVSVMLDKQCANLIYIDELKRSAEVEKCRPPGIFHHKILLLSNKNKSRLLVIGSFNFSTAAQTRNYENIFGIFSSVQYKKHKMNWKRKRLLNTARIGVDSADGKGSLMTSRINAQVKDQYAGQG